MSKQSSLTESSINNLENENQFLKTYTNDKGSIKFSYTYSNKKDNVTEYYDTEAILDICFNKVSACATPIEIITLIRTILRNYEEDQLILEINNQTKYLAIEIKNKKTLFFCVRELVEIDGQKETFNADYEFGKELKFSLSNNSKVNIDVDAYYDFMLSSTGLMEELEQAKSKKISRDDRRMCEFYKAFYGETPNFTEEDVNVKYQVMMVILLSLYRIPLSYRFELNNYNGQIMPISETITAFTTNLIPFGKIKDFKEYDIVPKNLITIIKAVSSSIKEIALEEENELDTLIKISNILYNNNFNIRNKVTKTNEKANYTAVEANAILTKIKKASKHISKN